MLNNFELRLVMQYTLLILYLNNFIEGVSSNVLLYSELTYGLSGYL